MVWSRAGKGSDFLPAADSDFIYTYSILEYGTIMGVFILLLYLVFYYRIILLQVTTVIFHI